MSRARRFIGNLLLCTVSIAMTLLLAELLWRTITDNGDRRRVFTENLRFVNPPNTEWTIRTREYKTHMRTNSIGFRGPEMPQESKGDELRILFLGDSFVEAKQVEEEDRFVRRTAEMLSKAMDRSVIARGLGIGGANPALQLLYYREIGTLFDPDITVQVLFPENDLLPPEGPFSFREEGDDLVLEDVWVEPEPACDWKCMLLRRSFLLRSVYRVLRGEGSGPPGTKTLGDYYWYTAEGQISLAREKRWQVLGALVEALRDSVEQDGGIFLAVLMPGALEMQQAWQEEYLEGQPYPRDSWQIGQLLSETRSALEDDGIAVLDLRDAFRETVTDAEPLYYKTDPHLSEKGHRIVAEALVKRALELLRNRN